MASSSGKKYGLLSRKPKTAPVLQPRLSAFGNSSDEEDSAHSAVNHSLMFEASKQKVKKQTQLEIQRALAQDPTVYEYDSIYDSMKRKKEEKIQDRKRAKDSKPKYMEKLLKAAAGRKREQERLLERKVQREREAEGLEFADKEAFVTSAYKKKMQDMAEEEEQERREAEMEAANDVTKQSDMSGFYRHILDQTTSKLVVAKPDVASAKISEEGSQDKVKHDPAGSNRQDERSPQREDGRHRSDSSDDEYERGHKYGHRDRGDGRGNKSSSHLSSRHPRRGSDIDDDSDSNNRRHPKDGGHTDSDTETRDKNPRSKSDKHQRYDDREDSSDNLPRKPEDLTRTEKSRDQIRARDKQDRTETRDVLNRVKSEDVINSGQNVPVKDAADTSGSKFAKRNVEETVMSAKERYLARKLSKGSAKSHVTIEDD